MNGKHYVGQRVSSLDLYDELPAVTGVALVVGDESEYFSGDETGYVLEAECPYATQRIADNILARIRGNVYKGFRAQDASLGLDSELGDSVTVDGTDFMLAYQKVSFGPGHVSEIAAPGETAVDHEYPYISSTQREIRRNKAEAYSLITKTAEEIRLEVNTKTSAINEGIKETLNAYSTIEQTDASITATVKAQTEYTDAKTGEIVKSLENYSTIEQTTDAINTAVSSTKEYSDGQLTEKLKNYSTTEQTTDAINTAVSATKEYSDGQLTEKLKSYSTTEQTTDAINTAVSATKEYSDGQLTEKLKSYSTTEQTTDAINTAVSTTKEYSDGQLTEKLKNYSTTTQTANAIESAIREEIYTVTTGEDGSTHYALKYSTIAQTTNQISQALTESKQYSDGRLSESLKNYSTIKQTTDAINTAVSSAKEYSDGQLATKLSAYSTTKQTAASISSSIHEALYTGAETDVLPRTEYEFTAGGRQVSSIEFELNKSGYYYVDWGDTEYDCGVPTVVTSATFTSLALTTDAFSIIYMYNNSTMEVIASRITPYADASSVRIFTRSSTVETEKYSTVKQTASSIAAAVSGLVDGDYVQSAITTSLEGISLDVSSSEGSSTFVLKGGTAELWSGTFDLHVDAANIDGKLTADKIEAQAITADHFATGAIPTKLSQFENDKGFKDYTGVVSIIDGMVDADFINSREITANNIKGQLVCLYQDDNTCIGYMSMKPMDTDAFDITSYVSTRITAAAGYNAHMGVKSGPSFTAYGDGRAAVTGKLQLTSGSFGYNLPETGAEKDGQVYFLLQS